MKLSAGTLIIILLFAACKKEPVIQEESAFISFVNTVPVVPGLFVFVDTTSLPFKIPYRGSYRNLQVTPGSHLINVKDSTSVKTYITLSTPDFANNESSTIIIFDTLHPVDSTVRAIRLFDDQTLPPAGFVKVRFINAAPLVNAVDVTFVRTNVTRSDSVTLSAQLYIGNAANVQALSLFQDIPLGDYTLKIKSVGTQDTLLTPVKLTGANLAGSARISGIVTFYLTGGVQGQALEVGTFRHYP